MFIYFEWPKRKHKYYRCGSGYDIVHVFLSRVKLIKISMDNIRCHTSEYLYFGRRGIK